MLAPTAREAEAAEGAQGSGPHTPGAQPPAYSANIHGTHTRAAGWQEAASKGVAVGLPLLVQNVGKDNMAPEGAAAGVFRQNNPDGLH